MRKIAASRCILEPQVAEHAAEMFRVLSDPAICELENQAPQSQDWLALRYRRLESRSSADGIETWLNWVIRLPSKELAGYVQATILQSGVAYVAYELGSRHWRQGIASSAVRAMLEELRSEYGVIAFVAVLKAKNFRPLALLRSLGFGSGDAEQQAPYRDDADELVMVRAAAQAQRAD